MELVEPVRPPMWWSWGDGPSKKQNGPSQKQNGPSQK